MSETDAQACPAPAPDHAAGEDLDKSGVEDSVNNSQNNSMASDSEPSAKKPRESRRSKGPHKRVDDLAAAEAKAVCGEVDTSAGRQLRKREPPAKPEPKPAKATGGRGKKDTTPAKKGSPAKKAKESGEENESKSSEQESETPSENSTKDEPNEAKEENNAEAVTQSVVETKEPVDNAVASHDGETNDKPAASAMDTEETKAAETPAVETPAAEPAATE